MLTKVVKKFTFVKDLLAFSNTLLLKTLLYIIPGSYNGTKYIKSGLVEWLGFHTRG